MSEMIERVANAIDALERASGWDDGYIDKDAIARAAIEAMREPSEPIIEAISDYINRTPIDPRGKAKAIWNDAIAAALKPDQPANSLPAIPSKSGCK